MAKDRFDCDRVFSLPVDPEGLIEFAEVMRDCCSVPSPNPRHLGNIWQNEPYRIVRQMKGRMIKAAREIERLKVELERKS